MHWDLARFAARLDRLSCDARDGLDDDTADRQLLLEGLISATLRLAREMSAAALSCPDPDCTDHLPTPTTA